MYDFLVTQGYDSVTPPAIGAAPTSLAATADSDSIALAWTNGDTYTAVIVYRKSTGDFEPLSTEAGNAESYDDTSAVAGTTYTYTVRGTKGGYPTPYSNEDSDTIPLSTAHSAAFDGVDGVLTKTTTSGIDITDLDNVIVGMWVKASAFTVAHTALNANQSAGTTSYRIRLLDDSTVQFAARSQGGVVTVASTPTLSDDTKYFILGWKDVVGTSINISINGGAEDTTTYTPGVRADGGFDVTLGDAGNADTIVTTIDEVFVCKNPADIAAAVTLAKSLYNSGNGKKYADISAGNKTTLGLVSWWTLDEASSTREDSQGSNDLTPTGGVSQATALVA